MRYLVFILFFLVFWACKNDEKNHQEQPLAKAGDTYLYPSDLLDYLAGTTGEDSILLTQRLVEDWIKDRILLKKAEEQLVNLAEIEMKVKKYRENLMLAEYRNALLRKHDIGVTDNEIDQYYISHIENYLAAETYLMINYIVLPKETDRVANLVNLLNKDSVPHFIMNYCATFPDKCVMADDYWVTQEKLKFDILLPEYYHQESNQYKLYETEDETFLIYKILERRNKGEVIPLVLVKNQIRQILSFKKKRDKLQEIEDKAFINAVNSRSFEIY